MTHQKTCPRVVGATDDGRRVVLCGEAMPCAAHTVPNRKLPWQCRWFGHRWIEVHLSWARNWRCQRCQSIKAPCSNCGSVHDPNAITICSVTRGAR